MLQFEKRQRKLILVYTKAGCNNLFSPKIMSSRPLFSRVSSSLVAFTFTIAALYGLPLHLLFQLALEGDSSKQIKKCLNHINSSCRIWDKGVHCD